MSEDGQNTDVKKVGEKDLHRHVLALAAELPGILNMTIGDYFANCTQLSKWQREAVEAYKHLTLHAFMVKDMNGEIDCTTGGLEHIDLLYEIKRFPLNHLSPLYDLYCGATELAGRH